jgi:hypothetical protein
MYSVLCEPGPRFYWGYCTPEVRFRVRDVGRHLVAGPRHSNRVRLPGSIITEVIYDSPLTLETSTIIISSPTDTPENPWKISHLVKGRNCTLISSLVKGMECPLDIDSRKASSTKDGEGCCSLAPIDMKQFSESPKTTEMVENYSIHINFSKPHPRTWNCVHISSHHSHILRSVNHKVYRSTAPYQISPFSWINSGASEFRTETRGNFDFSIQT